MSCFASLPTPIDAICTFWYTALTSTSSGYTPPAQFYYLYQVANGNSTICTGATDPVLIQICSLNSNANGSPAVMLQAMAAIAWMSNNSNSNPQQTYLQTAFQALYKLEGVVTSPSAPVVLNFYNYVMNFNFYSGISDSSVETIWARYVVPFVTLMNNGTANVPGLNPVQFITTNAESMTVSTGTFNTTSIPVGINTYTPISNANSQFTLTAEDFLYTIDLGNGSVTNGAYPNQKFFTLVADFTAVPDTTIAISLPQVLIINNTQDTITGTIGGIPAITVPAGATSSNIQMTSIPLSSDSLKGDSPTGGTDFIFAIDLGSGKANAGSGSNQAAYTASITSSGALYTITVSTATVVFTNDTLNSMVFTFATGTDTSKFFSSSSPSGALTSGTNTILISPATVLTTPLVVTAVVDDFITSCGSTFTFTGSYGPAPGTSTGTINVSFTAGSAPTVTPATASKDFSVSSSFDQTSLTYSFGLTDNSKPAPPPPIIGQTMTIINSTGSDVTLSMTYSRFDNTVLVVPVAPAPPQGITYNPDDGTYTISGSICSAPAGCSINIPSKDKFSDLLAPVWDTTSNKFVFTDTNNNWIYLTVIEGVAPALFSYSCGGYGSAPPIINAGYAPPIANPATVGTYSLTIPESTAKQNAIVFNNNTPYNIFTDIPISPDPIMSCSQSKYTVYSPGLVEGQDNNSVKALIISSNSQNVIAQYKSSFPASFTATLTGDQSRDHVVVNEGTKGMILDGCQFTISDISKCLCSTSDFIFAISCGIVNGFCTVNFGYKNEDITAIYLYNSQSANLLYTLEVSLAEKVFDAFSSNAVWSPTSDNFTFAGGGLFTTVTANSSNLPEQITLVSADLNNRGQVTIDWKTGQFVNSTSTPTNIIETLTFGGGGGQPTYTLVFPTINSLDVIPPATLTIANNTAEAITIGGYAGFTSCAANDLTCSVSIGVALTNITLTATDFTCSVNFSASPLTGSCTTGASDYTVTPTQSGNSYTVTVSSVSTITFQNNTYYPISPPASFGTCTSSIPTDGTPSTCSVDLTIKTGAQTFTAASGDISIPITFGASITQVQQWNAVALVTPVTGGYTVAFSYATLEFVYSPVTGSATTIYMDTGDANALQGYVDYTASGYTIDKSCIGSAGFCSGNIATLASMTSIPFKDENSTLLFTIPIDNFNTRTSVTNGPYSVAFSGAVNSNTIMTITYTPVAVPTTVNFINKTAYPIEIAATVSDHFSIPGCLTGTGPMIIPANTTSGCQVTLASTVPSPYSPINPITPLTFNGQSTSLSPQTVFTVSVAIAGTSIVSALNISATPSGTSPKYNLEFDIGTFTFNANVTPPPTLYIGSNTPVSYNQATSLGSYLNANLLNISDDSAYKNSVFSIDFINQLITNFASEYMDTTISNNTISVFYTAPITYTINFTNTTFYTFTGKGTGIVTGTTCSTSAGCTMNSLGKIDFTGGSGEINFSINFNSISDSIINTFVQVTTGLGNTNTSYEVTIAPQAIEILSTATDALTFTLSGVSGSVSSTSPFKGTVGTLKAAVPTSVDFYDSSTPTIVALTLNFSNTTISSQSKQGYGISPTYSSTGSTVPISQKTPNANSTTITFLNTSAFPINIPGAMSVTDFTNSDACLTAPTTSSPYQIPTNLTSPCTATLAGGFTLTGSQLFTNVGNTANFTINFNGANTEVTVQNGISATASCAVTGGDTTCSIAIGSYANTITASFTGGLTQIVQDSGAPSNFIYLDPTTTPPSLVVYVKSPAVSVITSKNTRGWPDSTPTSKKNDAFALQWISEQQSTLNLSIVDKSNNPLLTLISNNPSALGVSPTIVSLGASSEFVDQLTGNMTITIDQEADQPPTSVELNSKNFYPFSAYTYPSAKSLPSGAISGSAVTGNTLSMSITRATAAMTLDLTLISSDSINLYPYYVFNNDAFQIPSDTQNPNNGIVNGTDFTFTFVLAKNNLTIPTGINGIQNGTISVTNNNATVISFTINGTLTAANQQSVYTLNPNLLSTPILSGTIEGASIDTTKLSTVTITNSSQSPYITLSGTLAFAIKNTLNYTDSLKATITLPFTTS